MGITYIDGTASGPTGKGETVSLVVDSGATYTLLPTEVWESIELEPTRKQTFTLADGTRVRRCIATCYLVLPQGETQFPVILGEPGDEALRGVVTLDELGLIFHPFSRTLHPIRRMLA